MSSSSTSPLNYKAPAKAVEAFAEYISAERERLTNSGEEFDPGLFDEAADLVSRKLEKLEQEGLA